MKHPQLKLISSLHAHNLHITVSFILFMSLGQTKTLDNIKIFINRADGPVSAIELQKIMFFADIHATEEFAARVTEAKFKPMMYGPYSPDIREALDHLIEKNPEPLIIRSQTRNGNSEKIFNYANLPDTDRTNQKRVSYINHIMNVINILEWGVDELSEFCKNSSAYQMAISDDKEYVSFSDYRDKIEDDEQSDIGVYNRDNHSEDSPPEWAFEL